MADRGLIGRDEESARLGKRLDRAVAGEGGLVLLDCRSRVEASSKAGEAGLLRG